MIIKTDWRGAINRDIHKGTNVDATNDFIYVVAICLRKSTRIKDKQQGILS